MKWRVVWSEIMRKLKTIITACTKVLEKKNYIIAFIAMVLFFFSIFILMPVFFIPANTLSTQLTIFRVKDYALLILLSTLASLLIVMQAFSYKHAKQCSPGKAVVGSGSAIVAALVGTASCASCLIAVFGLLGLGIGAVSLLIKYQWIIVSIGIGLILISLYFTSVKIAGVCVVINTRDKDDKNG